MSLSLAMLRRHSVQAVAILLILASYSLARPPQPSESELEELAARFDFEMMPIAAPEGLEARTIRAVHPSLEHISAWISSVGASVALHDLDGDTRDNDLCLVDPRFDSVSVQPVPGTGEDRYASFILPVPPTADDPSTIAPMGCLPGDFDENGRADLLVYFWGRTPVLYLQRAPENRRQMRVAIDAAVFEPVELVANGGRWYTNAMTRADVDGDGHPDLVVGNYFQDESRILDPNADGSERMQDSMSRARNAGRSRLLLWAGAADASAQRPDVRFVDVTDTALDDPVAHGWTLAIAAADLDGDQLPELYFAQDFGPDAMLHNRSTPGKVELVAVTGRRGLRTPASKVIGRDSFKGMGVDFGDLNQDGHLDLFVSNIAEEYALEESHFAFISTGDVDAWAEGRAPYIDRSEDLGLARSGWSWETKIADFDNDGVLEAVQATGFVRGVTDRWPELHEVAMGNDQLLKHPDAWPRVQPGDDLSGDLHNPFFVRGETGRFLDIAPMIGFGQTQVTRGIAVADVDRDGDLDIAIANQWDTSRVYRNDAPAPGASLDLTLLVPLNPTQTRVFTGVIPASTVPARFAIGAEARVTLPDGRVLVAQVDGGNGHSGARSPRLHFGLGTIDDPDTLIDVAVRWRAPDGSVHSETLEARLGANTFVLGWGVDSVKTPDQDSKTAELPPSSKSPLDARS
ncbi:MAG: CRTAC1 family protein [Acidobacteriota bacterium]